jgi:hypothetical protein
VCLCVCVAMCADLVCFICLFDDLDNCVGYSSYKETYNFLYNMEYVITLVSLRVVLLDFYFFTCSAIIFLLFTGS